jgi:hypothetical protein
MRGIAGSTDLQGRGVLTFNPLCEAFALPSLA